MVGIIVQMVTQGRGAGALVGAGKFIQPVQQQHNGEGAVTQEVACRLVAEGENIQPIERTGEQWD